jgi:Asp-tRNA(Asn)/Glu-tRNA(Gln) amidotransferase A subunit family amidase
MEESTSSLRLGAPRECFWKELDPEIEKAADEAVTLLGKITRGIREVSLPEATDLTVARCEPFVFHHKYLAQSMNKYNPETLLRIRSGTGVTATQYVERHRDLLRFRREILPVFENIDLLVTPTCPVLPPTIAELEASPEALRRREAIMLRNTLPFNVSGLPTITIPCGFSESGLPIGLQITGAPATEHKVFCLALAYERQTNWHERKPGACLD